MRDPQLQDGEQIAWVIPWRDSKYVGIYVAETGKADFRTCDTVSEALCLAREADAKALAALLRHKDYILIREPERRVVKSDT